MNDEVEEAPALRPFLPADSMEVAALVSSAPSAAQWSPESYALLAESPYFAYVLARGNKIVGFLAVRVVAGEAEVLNMVVDRPYRRRRYGAQLLATAEREAARRGAGNTFLEVRESNSSAASFYVSQGFVQCGVRLNYYRNPDEAAIVMKKLLMRKA